MREGETMSTELHLTITAVSAADALSELMKISFRAAQELGVAPQQADTAEANAPEPAAPEKGNGAAASSAAPEVTAGTKRTRKAKPEPEEAAPDRAAIIKGLTELYMGGDPKVRSQITEFRDGHGAERLRDLKDEALPAAAQLLTELKLAADSAP
jgi:hypothetical protein